MNLKDVPGLLLWFHFYVLFYFFFRFFSPESPLCLFTLRLTLKTCFIFFEPIQPGLVWPSPDPPFFLQLSITFFSSLLSVEMCKFQHIISDIPCITSKPLSFYLRVSRLRHFQGRHHILVGLLISGTGWTSRLLLIHAYGKFWQPFSSNLFPYYGYAFMNPCFYFFVFWIFVRSEVKERWMIWEII